MVLSESFLPITPLNNSPGQDSEPVEWHSGWPTILVLLFTVVSFLHPLSSNPHTLSVHGILKTLLHHYMWKGPLQFPQGPCFEPYVHMLQTKLFINFFCFLETYFWMPEVILLKNASLVCAILTSLMLLLHWCNVASKILKGINSH